MLCVARLPFDSVLCSGQLLYQEANEGIRYEYSVPRTVAAAGSAQYSWVASAWSQCSEQCGSGEAPTRTATHRRPPQLPAPTTAHNEHNSYS